MTNSELRKHLIRIISQIDDPSYLKAIKTILDSKTDSTVIQLDKTLIDDIAASKKDIERGSFVEHRILNKEVKRWLKVR